MTDIETRSIIVRLVQFFLAFDGVLHLVEVISASKRHGLLLH